MPVNIIPQGFKDDVSVLVSTEHKFKNMMINHFETNGFSLIKTPLIEYVGKDTDNNAFHISVKKNEKKINIRDDITLQVARLSETRLSKKQRPLKLCYYGEVVRKKGSMLRPERQFLQIGAECIGEDSFFADVEMLELAYTSLKLVGIKKMTIEISSRIFYDKFIKIINFYKNKNTIIQLIKLKDLNGLLNILDKKDHKFIKDLFSCTGIYKDTKNNLKNLSIDDQTNAEITNITHIVKNFSYKNKDINFFLDLCEIDDKNYHSGVRFTFFADNVRGEIAKAGRYYVKNALKENVATGFTCYMDSILRASSLKFIEKKIMIPLNTSKKKINQLIKKGLSLYKNTNNSIITKKLSKQHKLSIFS